MQLLLSFVTNKNLSWETYLSFLWFQANLLYSTVCWLMSKLALTTRLCLCPTTLRPLTCLNGYVNSAGMPASAWTDQWPSKRGPRLLTNSMIHPTPNSSSCCPARQAAAASTSLGPTDLWCSILIGTPPTTSKPWQECGETARKRSASSTGSWLSAPSRKKYFNVKLTKRLY